MAALVPVPVSSMYCTYSRKQKSLGLLCTNFFSLYNRDNVHLIGLADAADRLGVERRRIYDIVNVLESIGVLTRKAKNQYIWNGFGAIPAALQELKEEGLKKNTNALDHDGENDNAEVSSDEEDDEETSCNPSTGSQNDKSNPNSTALPTRSLKNEKNRREKSLAGVTQNFVKLFLCSNVEMISLEDAAKLLLGDAYNNSSIMRTKARRLYDIANVLSSVNLIEKTQTADTRKPVFRWLGFKEETCNESLYNLKQNESRKRTFGNEITNTSFTRNEMDLFSQNTTKKQKTLEHQQGTKQTSKSYLQFGPFGPVSVPKVETSENNNVKQVHDWESLASAHHPQYQNQALRELYVHYMEAWKLWYSQVAAKRRTKFL